MSKNIYLVPHDFTAVGDTALNYALHMGKKVNTDIILLHLCASKAEFLKSDMKMDQIIANQNIPAGINIRKIIKVGSIFDAIGGVAEAEGAQLVIMGTHGATGLQKLFGSNAMKVITSADIPFLIVQKDTPLHDVKNIIVPIDLTKESLQIVNVAGDMAGIFGATVHVVGEKQNDELLSQQMKNRILIVKNQYDERSVPVSVSLMERGGAYTKKIIAYTKEQKIDMIALAYHSESLLPQFDGFAQALITNETKLPCLIMNSKPASSNAYF